MSVLHEVTHTPQLSQVHPMFIPPCSPYDDHGGQDECDEEQQRAECDADKADDQLLIGP